MTPNSLKIFLTTWGLAQDFHIAQGAVDAPYSGETHPATLLKCPQGIANSKSKVNWQCRKMGQPKKELGVVTPLSLAGRGEI
jgi:hypothetical protein